MRLRDFKMIGGDDNHVVIIVDGIGVWEVHSVEEGKDNDTDEPETWIVAGDPIEEGDD